MIYRARQRLFPSISLHFYLEIPSTAKRTQNGHTPPVFMADKYPASDADALGVPLCKQDARSGGLAAGRHLCS